MRLQVIRLTTDCADNRAYQLKIDRMLEANGEASLSRFTGLGLNLNRIFVDYVASSR
jgi:hypothetical protein